jgi:putative colanic acid biosynthesis glycosyltransferase
VSLDDLDGLRATEASLRLQSHRDFEWIVADGGSADGTARWLSGLPAPPVWWRSAPDRGLYDAMNRGMRAARGEYLLFLNAGDRLAGADTLARLAEAIDASGRPELVYGDSIESGVGGRPALKPARSHRAAWWGMFASHQSMLFRRDAVAGLGYDGRWAVAADYAFVLRFMRSAPRPLRVPFPVSACAPAGLSARAAAAGRREQAEIRARVLGMPRAAIRAIERLQTLAWGLRERWPKLFECLRFRRSPIREL